LVFDAYNPVKTKKTKIVTEIAAEKTKRHSSSNTYPSIESQFQVHIAHQKLQFLNSQSKIQERHHLKWSFYFQQFHFVNKYRKGSTNKVIDFLSRNLAKVLNIHDVRYAAYEDYKDICPTDPHYGPILESI
jgi:hypothetical protein